MKNFSYLFLAILVSILVFADRLAKILAQNTEKNIGAAFGILPGFSILFIAVAVVIIFLILKFYKKCGKPMQIALILILAGTISNTLDRIFLGYVIDFIRIPFISNSSTFNLADICNVAGAAALLISLIKKTNGHHTH